MLVSSEKNDGFSLIGVGIALVIIGLMMGTWFQQYRLYTFQKPVSESLVRRDEIGQAFVRYLTNNNFLPCPAPPALPFDSPFAGKSADCAALIADHSRANPPFPWCDADPASPTAGMCVVDGGRNTLANGTADPDPVVIGAIPYTNLGVPVSASLDGWKNRMTYAVSGFLTDSSKYNDQYGVIDQLSNVIDPVTHADNIQSIVNSDTGAAKSFILAVVSHGPDGKGAFNYYGTMAVPCGSAPGRDNINCNNRDNVGHNIGASFLVGANGKNDKGHAIFSTAAGPLFYDDAFVLMKLIVDTDKWVFASASSKRIHNKAGGLVGIGTTYPAHKLDVNGSIRVDDLQTDSLCDKNYLLPDGTPDPAHCFRQDLISPGPNSQDVYCRHSMATGIYSSQMECIDAINTVQIIDPLPFFCPMGEYVTGVVGGRIKCALP